ncbi:MAG TPA: hypothetical protein VK272_02825 [Solirubrobacteraceae bacterium]|nr:hypothetical protein [Solirubrobacteraceae bacterium]
MYPRGRSAALWVGVPLAITLLCWRALPLQPRPGYGGSWEAALHMALHEGVTFGNHLIYTYGPLGFLSVPTLWYSDTGFLAVLYTAILRFAFALALFAGARRTYGTRGGALVALVVAGVSEAMFPTVPMLVLGVWMIDRVPAARVRLALMAIAGAVAGVELLNKESIGISITLMVLVIAIAMRGRRRDQVLVTLAALVFALVIGWTASGQDLGQLPAFVGHARSVVSGYAAAASLEAAGKWQYLAGLIAFAIGVAGVLQMTADGPARRRWGILALWLVFCFFEFKEGFVRHDREHATRFFVAMMAGFLALRWRWKGWEVGLGLLGVLCLFAIAAQRSLITQVDNPVRNVKSAFSQLADVSSTGKRASIIARGRRAIEREYPLEASTLSQLRGHTVHAAPYQAAAIWAYRLRWRPIPVFQSVSADTTTLDEIDAEFLRSSRAPERILRIHGQEIDGRVETFDDGLTTRTMLCRYDELSTTETAQVLALGSNRCGAITPLNTVHAGWNQAVPIPAPPNDHSFVFARVSGVTVGGLERLVGLVYKPRVRTVLLDGVSTRLVEETAADGLVLRAPAAIDFSKPFNVAPNPATIAVGKGGAGGGKPITFSFYAQSVNAPPRPASAPAAKAPKAGGVPTKAAKASGGARAAKAG